MEAKEIYSQVNKRYGSVDKSATGKYEQTVAKAFGYTEEELAAIPEGANLGLSCGNPLALAKLRKASGETVIDFGSGAGFDVFAAANMVGLSGMAIGVDMNENMIKKANANKTKSNAKNLKFIEGAITAVPLHSSIADCIISNCVINLVPASEKQLAFNEMYRLIRPGGRVAISDILARKELTEDMKKNISLYVGCISGASLVSEYEAYLTKAGFRDVLVVDSQNDLNVYLTGAEGKTSCYGAVKGSECCIPEQKDTCRQPGSSTCSCQEKTFMTNESHQLAAAMGIVDFNEWAGSFKVYAVKPLETEE